MTYLFARRSFLIVAAMFLSFAGLMSNASASDYHDMVARAVTSQAGVIFKVVPRLDATANLVYAEGDIDATNSSTAGRINYIVLEGFNSKVPGATWYAVSRTPVGQTRATNDAFQWGTPAVTCTPGFEYRARLEWHLDGTALTHPLGSTASAPTNC